MLDWNSGGQRNKPVKSLRQEKGKAKVSSTFRVVKPKRARYVMERED